MDPEAQALALATDYQQRAEAGRRLAAFAGHRDADALLLRLLLDHENTWVSTETAEALLARGDRDGLRVLLRGIGAADEDTFNKVSDRLWETDWEELSAAAESLAQAEPDLRTGCQRLLTFFDVNPWKRPVQE